jgi:transposase
MKRKYDDEFKQNIMRKVLDGQPVRSISQEMGINEGLIHKWKKAMLQNGNGIQSSIELNENLILKKRVRELETEVEILKKATLIFGRGS